MKSFTLIETLITIAIFSILVGAVSSSIVMLYRTHGYSFQQSSAIDEARRGIETMVKEIREAKSGDDGSYIIGKADDFEFIFYSDIDKDEATERVRYFIDGSDFKKGVIEPVGFPVSYPLEAETVSFLSRYVRNLPPIFHYYDGDGFEIVELPARLKDTKLMKVYLTVNVDPSRAPSDYTLQSSVQIRNLKTNL